MVRRTLIASAFILSWAGPATAGVQDWELSEVLTSAGGDDAARYVELANPAGGCLFPTSRVVVFDESGDAVSSIQLVNVARCFAAGSYFLAATSAAAAHFGVSTDLQMAPTLPQDAAQVCFVSSDTRYDCVRWGALSTTVPDFFGVSDLSVAVAPPDSQALGRTQTTHVVRDDWVLLSPTPRGPNDGTPWFPPDAGPPPDAAAPPPDAMPVPDATFVPDARPLADADPQRYLDVTPAGGATCSCATRGAGRGSLASLLLVALAIQRSMRPGKMKG